MIFARATNQSAPPQAVDPAKQVEAALGDKIPSSIHHRAEALREAREARVAAVEISDKFIAQMVGRSRDLPRSASLEEKIGEARAEVARIDAEIVRAMGQLNAARQAFEPDNVAAIKAEFAGLVPGLRDALAVIEGARRKFFGAHRHCARHGLTSPAFLAGLPPTDTMKKAIEHLARR